MTTDIRNFLSFDVEEWYQANCFRNILDESSLQDCDNLAMKQTEFLLDIMRNRNIKATFFILGSVAKRLPELVKRIPAEGHEIASHGYSHHPITETNPDKFRDDVLRSLDTIEAISGQKVLGYRAPSWSISSETHWALDILAEEGLQYDSSIYPIPIKYGIPNAPRYPYRLTNGMMEFPLATVRPGIFNVPVAGGLFFRIFPYTITRWAIKRMNGEGMPAVVYLHPWELDPSHPRIPLGWKKTIIHYYNLESTKDRLERLIRDFKFETISSYLHRNCK